MNTMRSLQIAGSSKIGMLTKSLPGKKKQKKQSKANSNDKSNFSKTSTSYKHKVSSCVSDEEESNDKESPVVQENVLVKEKKICSIK